jgi:hypothetical protein
MAGSKRDQQTLQSFVDVTHCKLQVCTRGICHNELALVLYCLVFPERNKSRSSECR